MGSKKSKRKNLKKPRQKSSNPKKTLSTKKRYLFRLILILTPFFLLLLLEILLRLTGYGYSQKIFQESTADSHYLEVAPDIGRRYFPRGQFYPNVTHGFILKEKPANDFRIFVLGGSSARGYPYYYNGSFSSMLQIMLQKSYPDICFETVNLSMVAVNSYTVRDLLPKIRKYEPDLVLIYSGHNEFYGALGVGSVESLGASRPFVLLFLEMNRFRTFQLIRNVIFGVRQLIQSSIGAANHENGTVMERMVKKKEIAYHSPDYLNAKNIFRKNFADVVEMCRKSKIPLILGTLVSNVRDQKPFVDSFHSNSDTAQWKEKFRAAGEAIRQGNYDSTEELLQQCIQIDSLPASQYFTLGRAEEATGATALARKNFYKAKDLDALRFRASEDFNQALVDLANSCNVPIAPVKRFFEAHSPDKIPGKALLLEHLHPNLRGYFLMAKAFYQAITENNFIESNRTAVALPPDSLLWQDLGLTPLDEEVGKIRIKVLTSGWPFIKGEIGTLESIRYQPHNRMQELALSYWKNEITWEKAHVYLADYYLKNEQFDLAENEFKALVVFTPFNPSPYRHLISIYMKQNRLDEALSCLQKLAQISNDLLTQRTLGLVYLQKSFPEKAIYHLEIALRYAANDQQTLYWLGIANYQLGRLEEASGFFRRLKRINSNYPGLDEMIRKTTQPKS